MESFFYSLGELTLDVDTSQQEYTTRQSTVQVTSIELTEDAKTEYNTPQHNAIDTGKSN